MVKETKYYDLLEVTAEASDADLKKAYRKKALRLHPDKGGDPELFKEVTHAYEVLSDPQKRSVYDTRGEAGLSESGGMGGMDPHDLFSQIFGGGVSGFPGSFFGGSGRPSQEQRRGKDLLHRLHVTLEDLYKGKTTQLRISRNIICEKCKGKGGMKEGAVRQCTGCHGRGVKVVIRQVGPIIQQMQQACNDCDGSGEMINHKDRCKVCHGRKTVLEKKVLDVFIEKGMKGGQRITFSGESDQVPGGTAGDVVIEIEERPHDRFKRQESDLYIEQEIDLLSALAGGQFAVQHLDDRVLHINWNANDIIKPGAQKVVRGQGMPSQRHHDPGDLYVLMKVAFPDSIPPEVHSYLEKALPPRPALPKVPSNMMVDDVELTDLDARQQRRQDAMDEDSGGPAVQCAQQ